MADEFNLLRQELDSPFLSLELSNMTVNQRLQAQQVAIRRTTKVVEDLDNILVQMRQKPGFINFLRAESEAYLLSAAQEGPIIVLNVTELRSDAILVMKTRVKTIALPRLSHAEMAKHCSSSTDDNEAKREFLKWLWKAAVHFLLRELGFYPKQVHPLPRIWWIGVGLMAKAPIHAPAKFKNGRVQMTTIQYCLPPYTSTIR